MHTAWAALFILLGIAALRTAFVLYRDIARRTRSSAAEVAAARLVARMALLGGGGLTLLTYVLSPAPATEPWTTRRYLVGILAATPAVAWPLYRRARRLLAEMSVRRALPALAVTPAAIGPPVQPGPRRFLPVTGSALGLRSSPFAVLTTQPWGPAVPSRVSRRQLAGVASGLLLLAWTAALAAGVAEAFVTVPAAQSASRQQASLIDHLTALGATRIYADYWTCDRLAFASDERIVCATLNAQLMPDFDRYLPYRAAVGAAPDPWYVFPAGTPQDDAMAHWAAAGAGWQQLGFGGYDAYRPPPRPPDGPR